MNEDNNIPMSQFSGFQKIFIPEFMSILRKGDLNGDVRKEGGVLKESLQKEEAKTTPKKIESTRKVERDCGFVSSPVKIAKTADYNPEALLDRISEYFETASKQISQDYKDPLTITTVFPLLKLCREKDFFQEGLLSILW